MHDYIDSSDLFTNPSILKGSARLFDLFGWLDKYNYKKTGNIADSDAIRRDWSVIGNDILKAIKIYGQGSKNSNTNSSK